jgi:hypothetical protein
MNVAFQRADRRRSEDPCWLYRVASWEKRSQPRALIELGIGARAGRRGNSGLVRYCGSEVLIPSGARSSNPASSSGESGELPYCVACSSRSFVERQPELLAHHVTAAGDIKRAVTQWLKAGRHAAARSACREATGHFDRPLGLRPALSDPPERDRCEIESRV